MNWQDILKLDRLTIKGIEKLAGIIIGVNRLNRTHVILFRKTSRSPWQDDVRIGFFDEELTPAHYSNKEENKREYDINNPVELIALAKEYLNVDLTNDAAIRMLMEEIERGGFEPEIFNVKGLLQEKNPED